MKMRQWIGLYVIIVGTMIVIHWRMRRSHTILVRSLIQQMDALVAHYTTILWTNRHQVYEYDQHASLLFRTMDAMLHDPRASYHQYLDRWFEDVEFADSLLPDTIELPDTEHIRDTHESLARIERIYQSRGLMIAVLTLGLYLAWRQPLYTA